MVTEAERESKRACFLSTPSIFFSLNDKTLQANSKVFDVRHEHKQEGRAQERDKRDKQKTAWLMIVRISFLCGSCSVR